MLTSGQRDSETKTVARDQEGHAILIKRSVHQEDTTVIDRHAPKTEPPNTGNENCRK